MRYINLRLCLSLLLLSVPGLAVAETIELVQKHGVFMLPVRLNDVVPISFVLDSGAADVSVPEDVFKTLLRTGTVTESDFREPGVYVTADGSQHMAQRFILHEVRVGDRVVKGVVASVAPDKADPLLGQSFLGMLPRWTFDNTRHALVIGAGGGAEGPQAAIPTSPRPAAPAPTRPSPSGEEAPAYERGLAAYMLGDYVTAFSIFRPLAEQGNVGAQTNVGSLYLNGWGVARDYAKAARWFQKAAEQGGVIAQNNLGSMYENGEGVPQNYAEAARWYRKAADQNFAVAQNNIGWLYAHGRGVGQDYAEAARWYRKAADQGIALAQYNLGSLYAHGRGVGQDYAEAARWYRKAADQGDPNAQNNLAGLAGWGQRR